METTYQFISLFNKTFYILIQRCQSKISTDEIQEKKLQRAQQNKKCACCACCAKWPWGNRWFQHPDGIKPKQPDSLQLTLTTKQQVHIISQKKFVYLCHSQIVQVKYQGQTRNSRFLKTQTFDQYILSHSTQIGAEISLSTIFAQYSSSSSSTQNK